MQLKYSLGGAGVRCDGFFEFVVILWSIGGLKMFEWPFQGERFLETFWCKWAARHGDAKLSLTKAFKVHCGVF